MKKPRLTDGQGHQATKIHLPHALGPGPVVCVRMVEMVVPAQVMLGERATLQCIFDMEGEELYSVKWYKAGHEFFRYIPGDRDQRITTFNLPGITVEVSIGKLKKNE